MLLKRLSLLLFLMIFLSPALAWAGPKLALTKDRVDFEKPVIAGEMLKSEFEIQNVGDAELIIESVTPG